MNSHVSFKLLSAVILVGLAVALVSPSNAAETSRSRRRSGSYQTSAGRSGTFDSTTTRSRGAVERSGTITNQDGKTATYQSDASKTGAGESTRTATTTGPNGKTAERVISTQVNPDGSGSRVIEVTKPDGTTETRTETFTVSK